jgi:hypothetical protein
VRRALRVAGVVAGFLFLFAGVLFAAGVLPWW